MSRLDDVIAIVYGSFGGSIFACTEAEIRDSIARVRSRGQTAYVFRKEHGATGCRQCAGPFTGPNDLIHTPGAPGYHPYQ